METIQAKDFKTRNDLEKYVRNKYDLTPTRKDAEIVGTPGELMNLRLSERVIFWGIPCRTAETKKKKDVEVKKIDRGERVESGININKKKNK